MSTPALTGGKSVELDDVVVRFGRTTAIDHLSTRFEAGKIYGLLGRNGSGKTTLMSLIAGFGRPTSGAISVGGADPYSDEAMGDTCLIREGADVSPTESVGKALDFAAALRPRWDAGLAGRLMDRFELPMDTKVQKLSRGKRSALAIVLGLASRAPLTMLDEVHLGMDAPAREIFYAELLEDYLQHPRTMVLSTHLIDEVSSLFERVLIIDRGRTVVADEVESLRSRGAALVGPTAAVNEFTAGLDVLSERSLGPSSEVTVYGELGPLLRREARDAGLQIGPVGLQDLFIKLTAPEGQRRAQEARS